MTTPSTPLYREIPLPNKGLVALVSAEDYDRLIVHRWRAWWNKRCRLWYAVRSVIDPDGSRHVIWMHREIMGLKVGDPRTVDHRKTADTLNNQRGNLRFATHCEQMRNQRTPSDNISGIKGVSYEKDRDTYRAVITVNYKQIFLGRRKTKEAAAELYRAGQIKYHGEFANFD